VLTSFQTTKVTIDVIGKVICDHDFKTLSTDNEFMTTMRNTLSWMPNQQSINPFHIYNPMRPIIHKYYKYRMDNYIGKILDERFNVRDTKQSKKSRKKTGIDLALEEYFKENGQDVDAKDVTMDAEFRKAAIDNLLILLFAGHDTTASTLCYWYTPQIAFFRYILTTSPATTSSISTPPNWPKSAPNSTPSSVPTRPQVPSSPQTPTS
jgi:cytochrome P450